MPTEKEILTGFASKTLNMDEKGVASLLYNDDGTELKPDALSILTTKQAEAIKTRSTEKFQEGYKKAKGEVLSEFEKSVKEKFETDSDKQGVELVEDIVAAVQEKAGSKEVTDDDIKKSKLYLDAQDALKKVRKEADKEWGEKLTATEAKHKKEKVMSSVVTKAKQIRDSRNPVPLSDDEDIAKRQMALQDKLFEAELLQNDYDIQGEGANARIVLMKDGKIVEDDMGHAVDFTEFVNKTAEGLYTFKASSDRTSPEDKGGQGGTGGKGGAAGGKKYLSKKPANYEELSKTYEAIEADNSLKPDEKIKVQAELNEIYSGSKQVAV